ncbi:MAG: SPFH domain-containing protein [Bacilli bacterium]|nr:SPFH domain-containing protein [Bacilli bacterium]
MGLIKAAVGSVSSTLSDQWKEAIRCEDMDSDTLMVRKTTPSKVITNGSTIIVGPGQCAIIYDNGRILDATAEEGFYTFDSSSSPSLFAGDFGGFFKEMWTRFTYNGATSKEQYVFFFNLKEITKNKFGTSQPIMYKDWGHPQLNPRTGGYIAMNVKVRCFGTYTFKICDPFAFMQELAGTAEKYTKDEVNEQMRSEIVGAFSNVMNGLGSDKYKIEVMELQSKTDEIKKAMDENVFDENIRRRGIQLVSFVIENVSVDEESQAKMDNYELGGDQFSQQGTLVGAYSNAVQGAANNPNGAMNGFMGIGMMNMASGGMFGNTAGNVQNNTQFMQGNAEMAAAAQAPVQPAQPVQPAAAVATPAPAAPAAPAETGKVCSNCGAALVGKFCTECGTNNEVVEAPAEAPAEAPVEAPAEAPAKVFCTNCGNELPAGAKFCTECGTAVQQ